MALRCLVFFFLCAAAGAALCWLLGLLDCSSWLSFYLGVTVRVTVRVTIRATVRATVRVAIRG